ncbi:hypothetical protein [Kordiimonas sp.]|uniref:hypothetical protein n=1 Tax=Kordiimonas sp. TaxID=1970157 RepID=UPI003A8FD629
MAHPINVLLTGLPRNPNDLFMALNFLKSLPEIQIDRVLYSSWDNIDQDVIDFFLKNGAEVVLQRPARNHGQSNINHQFRSFIKGLSYFNEEDHVLKMRTDANGGLAAVLTSYLQDQKSEPSSRSPFRSALFSFLDQPIYIHVASLLYPGRIQENVFLGRKKELTSLAHCSSYFHNIDDSFLSAEYGPEFIWFGHGFVQNFPLVQKLFNYCDIRSIGNLTRRSKLEGPLQDFLSGLIAYNLLILFNNFKLPIPFEWDQAINFQDDFSDNLQQYGYWENQFFHDYRLHNRFLETGLQKCRSEFEEKIAKKMRFLSACHTKLDLAQYEDTLLQQYSNLLPQKANPEGGYFQPSPADVNKRWQTITVNEFPFFDTPTHRQHEEILKDFYAHAVGTRRVSMHAALVSFFQEKTCALATAGRLHDYVQAFSDLDMISTSIFEYLIETLPPKAREHLARVDVPLKDIAVRISGIEE